jgi:hypothetical protein
MNIQQARKPVKVVGRPLWQVSLMASIRRGQKRVKAMFCATALKHCAACGPQVLGRAA